MKVLAIDPGTKHCGVFDGVNNETWDFEGERPVRFAAFMQRLASKLREAEETGTPYDAVVYEFAFVRGPDATRCGFGIDGIIEAIATSAGVAVLDVNNNSLKKWARENGASIPTTKKGEKKSAAGKTAMIDFIWHKFQILTASADEADVIALWHYFVDKAQVTHAGQRA